MNEQLLSHREQATATAMAKSPRQIVVRLLLRCPQCKHKSLSIGKSTGDKHRCPSCGSKFIVK